MLFERTTPQPKPDEERQSYIERIHEENCLLRSDRKSLLAVVVIIIAFMTIVTLQQNKKMDEQQIEIQQLKTKLGLYELSNNL